jgi:AcrR family transcriptional regulator
VPAPSEKPTRAAPAPRRRQADRTREARQRLRDAAIAVLVERGYAGLTTKEVIARAGVSNGALMHHYASKMELVIDATADIYEAAIERGQRIARTPAAHRDPVAGFIKDCTSVYFEWPFIAALEVLVVARTDAALMEEILPVMQRYRTLTNDLWLRVLDDAGVPRPQAETVLNLTLNLVRGMAVNSLWQKDLRHYKVQLAQWAKVARDMLGGSARPPGG